jgi:hypothetical protein
MLRLTQYNTSYSLCVCLWGVMIFLKNIQLQITSSKGKNTCFLCEPHKKKKSQSHLQTKCSGSEDVTQLVRL